MARLPPRGLSHNNQETAMTENHDNEIPEDLANRIELLTESLKSIVSSGYSEEATRTASLQLFSQLYAVQLILALVIRLSPTSRALWALIEQHLGDARTKTARDFADREEQTINRAIDDVLGTLRMFQPG